VVEGPSSSVYGNYGMGGVINIVSARPKRQALEFTPQFGNLDSRKADFFGSNVWGNLGVSVDGSLFDTDGFPIVVENERGIIDNNAKVNFKNFNAKADYSINSRISAFVRAGHFRENRDNGKISTFPPPTEEANKTQWTTVNGGVRIRLPDSSDLQARIFTDDETFRSNFLAVAAANGVPRSVGRVTLNQKVPTTAVGSMVQWARGFGSKNYLTAGTDWHWVDGDSNEDALDPIRGDTVTLQRVSGGTQRSLGAYVQDIFAPTPKLNITLAARVDNWSNYDAHNIETLVPSGLPGPGNQPRCPTAPTPSPAREWR